MMPLACGVSGGGPRAQGSFLVPPSHGAPMGHGDPVALETPPQVLLCMAEQLGKLTGHVGGRQYAHELLVPLEQLAAVEESTVGRWVDGSLGSPCLLCP